MTNFSQVRVGLLDQDELRCWLLKPPYTRSYVIQTMRVYIILENNCIRPRLNGVNMQYRRRQELEMIDLHICPTINHEQQLQHRQQQQQQRQRRQQTLRSIVQGDNSNARPNYSPTGWWQTLTRRLLGQYTLRPQRALFWHARLAVIFSLLFDLKLQGDFDNLDNTFSPSQHIARALLRTVMHYLKLPA